MEIIKEDYRTAKTIENDWNKFHKFSRYVRFRTDIEHMNCQFTCFLSITICYFAPIYKCGNIWRHTIHILQCNAMRTPSNENIRCMLPYTEFDCKYVSNIARQIRDRYFVQHSCSWIYCVFISLYTYILYSFMHICSYIKFLSYCVLC